jgi:hypothetical protein
VRLPFGQTGPTPVVLLDPFQIFSPMFVDPALDAINAKVEAPVSHSLVLIEAINRQKIAAAFA